MRCGGATLLPLKTAAGWHLSGPTTEEGDVELYFCHFPLSSVLTDPSFIHFTADFLNYSAPLAAKHVTAHAPGLQSAAAGGGVINGIEEVYHPEEIQPSARDSAAAQAEDQAATIVRAPLRLRLQAGSRLLCLIKLTMFTLLHVKIHNSQFTKQD